MTTVRPITGKTVLYGMLAFFGVIFAVNAAFVYFALDTWPGLSTPNAYEKGVRYNTTLTAAEKQSALGWRSAVSLSASSNGQYVVLVRIKTKTGTAINALKIRLTLLRPTHEGYDQTIGLTETAPGRYEGETRLPLRGQWLGRIAATSPSGQTYNMQHELTVR